VELNVNLTDGEYARLLLPNKNLEAWGYVVKADKLRIRVSREDNFKARELLKKAVELDPDYTMAWAMLSHTYFQDFRRGWSTSRKESFIKADEMLKKALALDKNHPYVNDLLSGYYFYKKEYAKATAAIEKASRLSPNNASILMNLSSDKCYSGKYDEAVALAEKAMRLSPYPPAVFFMSLGRNYREAGRYDDAIRVYHELLNRSRQGEISPASVHGPLAIAYIYNGQEDKAKLHATELLKLIPNISNKSLNRWQKGLLFKDESRSIRFIDALRKALTLAGWEPKE
jgi:adenylate cyclase